MTVKYLGDKVVDQTVYFYFETYGADGESLTMTGLATSDIEIYKDGSVTQRTSDSGITLLDTDGIDFDGVTGLHGFKIDLSDNTHAGFYAAGSHYLVRVQSVTVNSQTVGFSYEFTIEESNGAIAELKNGTDGLSALKSLIDTIDTNVDSVLVDTGTTLDGIVDAILVDTATTIPALIAALDAVVDTVKAETALIVADTNELQSDDVPGLIATLDSVVDTVKADTAAILVDTGTTIPASLTTIDNEIATVDTVVDGIQTDLSNATDGLGALKALLDSILADTGTTLDTIVDAILVDTGTTIPGLIAALDAVVDTVKAETALIVADTNELQSDDVPGLIAALNDPTAAAIADAVWDEPLTGGSHNDATSAGRRLRQTDVAVVVHEGTAQAGTSTTITLDTGADGTNDDIYRGDRIMITAGTGVGEHDIITSYTASTRVANVAETWVVTPDATSEFVIVPASVDIETVGHVVQTGNDNGADINAILADTNEVQTDLADGGRLDALIDLIKVETDKLGDAMPDSIAADGAINTPIQALYMVQQILSEMSISGTTMTVKKVDGSTTLMTLTLNDAAAPTSLTRAT